jgi:hypothetical protein
VSPRTANARIEMPVDLPQEYDFEFSVTRISGSGELVVGFVWEGVQSMVYIDRATHQRHSRNQTSSVFKVVAEKKQVCPVEIRDPTRGHCRLRGWTKSLRKQLV